MNRGHLAFGVLLALLGQTAPARAQWVAGGNPVCTAARSQVETRAVSDGAGGAIVAWADLRNGGWDLYAQRLSAAGTPLWAAGGVPFCRARGDQDPLGIASDGAGGAIVVWHDYRCGGAVYAQRIDAGGHALWTADGVPLADVASEQDDPLCVSDVAGGAIVLWTDSRGWQFYAQRLDARGHLLWGAGGLATGIPAYGAALAADGAGGVFVAYALSNGMFGQHLGATGAPAWPGGVTLCNVGAGVSHPSAVGDGAGGMIAAWADGRLVSHPHIFAQRIGAGGAQVWQANGVAVCIANNDQTSPVAVSDGAHGAIVTWVDARSMTGTALYARRIGAAGDTLWQPQGNGVCAAAGSESAPVALSDGEGGAIVAWVDTRSADEDLYAQRMTHDGVLRWAATGVPLCTAAGDQNGVALVASDAGGVIAAWNDVRVSLANVHVYAQRVDSSGTAPGNTGVPAGAPGAFRVLDAAPNPARAGAVFRFELAAAAAVTADVFDARGRRVRAVARAAMMPAGRNALAWDGRDARGVPAAAGVYFVRVRAGSEEGRCKLVLAP